MVKSIAACVLMLLLVFSAGAAEAAQRTFVSASSGTDTNPCTRDLPCRSFGAAMSQTDARGEVVVLDTGGYGPVTISQAVAIIAPPGVHAAVTALSGNAISIAAGSTDVVILRGLYLNGLGGVHGIDFTGGETLHVENCVISGFASVGVYGRADGSDVFVLDTVSRQNVYGLFFTSSTMTRASLDSVRAEKNGHGVEASTNSTVTATRSVAAGNDGVGFYSSAPSGVIKLESCTTTMNNWGVYTVGPGLVRNSMITGNVTGVTSLNSYSFGNNGLAFNDTNGSFGTTLPQQ